MAFRTVKPDFKHYFHNNESGLTSNINILKLLLIFFTPLA